MLWRRKCAVLALAALIGAAATLMGTSRIPNLLAEPNASGVARSFVSTGSIDLGSPFFQSLGSNGRTCSTCHQQSDGWTVTPVHVQARFDATDGTDPIFRPNDGAVCPTADVSTADARRTAYKMLLSKGLIRVSMGVPAGAEFVVESIDDPYSCATPSALALFRRPLPGTNLRFLSTVMWDGRESPPGRSLHDNLASQAFDATMGHAQAITPPTSQQIEDIVALEMATSTAQSWDANAGDLSAQGAKGGPVPLTQQDFYLGINDSLGNNPTGATFDPNAFTLYSAWQNLSSSQTDQWTAARQAVARGEQLFNSRQFVIDEVGGLNDVLGHAMNGTCTTCHDSPNIGDHSLPAPLNIGIADQSRRTPDMPLYTLRCIATGQKFTVTDPGRALITGKCNDIGKFKGPILRGLAARPPYFHNGSAATLHDVVEFYNTRFNLGLSEQEESDLVAFLQTL